jgi:hypothetical protein
MNAIADVAEKRLRNLMLTRKRIKPAIAHDAYIAGDLWLTRMQ